MLGQLPGLFPVLARFAEPDSHGKMVRAGVVQRGLAHMDRNRYSNILPFDAHLLPCSLGYINASLCVFPGSGSSGDEYCIAAGPMKPGFYGRDTTEEFWAAVVENDCRVIVALAKFEPEFFGCADYLSAPTPGWTIEESSRSSPPSNAWIERTLHVRKASARGSQAEEDVRVVRHIHFKQWPNYGVPHAAPLVASLVRRTSEVWTETQGRILVHCSGGVGRSGAFVAMLRAHRELEPGVTREQQTGFVAATVAHLRQVRHPWMVETQAQFSLILDVLRML